MNHHTGITIPFHGAYKVYLREVAVADQLHTAQARRFAVILINNQGAELELIVGDGLPQQYLQMVHAIEHQFMTIL